MFLQNLRARVGARLSGESEAGFTLIELLVVMLILGILAAIALPAFFNQREKAGDSNAKENAHSAQVAVETYATENSGSYENVSLTALHNIEPTISTTPGVVSSKTEGIIVASTESGKGYVIQSVASTGNDFKITNASGAMSFTCTTAGKGGCPPAVAPATEGDWSK
ncbi:MAG TPA: type II secretion system protein [Solirubrobacterales bacterium]|jgi:type IV pilus assembly protein PilA|nr:type II secretion system protein [Solirubrobacterales bacterium]